MTKSKKSKKDPVIEHIEITEHHLEAIRLQLTLMNRTLTEIKVALTPVVSVLPEPEPAEVVKDPVQGWISNG